MQAESDTIIGQDRGLKAVFRTLQRVAPTESTVLVTGESGTGKELVVHYLHAQSRRRNKPFVPVNCGAIPRDLLESELFGHEKGAFTGAVSSHQGRFQTADHGTIFLDEIGELELSLQAKILRVLQEHEIEPVGSRKPVSVDVRVVAATNRDLEKMVAEGKFREDLFYRLQVIPVHLPPLRERGDDVMDLARFFMHKFCQRDNRPEIAISDEVCSIFKKYAWPGNVRELQNYMERMAVLVEGDELRAEDLPDKVLRSVGLAADGSPEEKPSCAVASAAEGASLPAHGAQPQDAGQQDVQSAPVQSAPIQPVLCKEGCVQPSLQEFEKTGLGLREFLESIELSLMKEAMVQEQGSHAKAAIRLGLKRTTLIEKLKRAGRAEGRQEPD